MQECVLVRQFFWRKLARLNFNIVLKNWRDAGVGACPPVFLAETGTPEF